MMMYVIGLVCAFVVGCVVGYRGYYEYVDYQWRNRPYQFKVLFDRRLKMLVEEGKIPTWEDWNKEQSV